MANAVTEALRQRIYSLCSAYGQGKLDFVLNFIDDDVDFVHTFEVADMDGAFPEGFYSTTNYRTQVRVGGEWIVVDARWRWIS